MRRSRRTGSPGTGSRRTGRSRNSGLTVLEMLLTTLILALATMVMAEGSRSVNAVYLRAMAKADAQMILSQIETQLRDELRFAEAIDPMPAPGSSGTVDTYEWRDGWCAVQIYEGIPFRRRVIVDPGAGAADMDKAANETAAKTKAKAPLPDDEMKDADGKLNLSLPAGVKSLSETALSNLEQIKVRNSITISYANGVFTVSGAEVLSEDGHTLAGPASFTVRAVSLS